MGTMAYDIRHVVKPPVLAYLTPNGWFYVRIGYNVCVQYLGGNEGGRRGDCVMQKLFVPEV